ncbi:LamG domain-containing protein [Conexibacter woesei]|uniref:LamG domain-containing protein n=1 Tax=Conexibacter woesei TaxID=191495 RepID=UPI0005A2CCE6|nr:LamG domain-containing protein [Conexibacter woesei]
MGAALLSLVLLSVLAVSSAHATPPGPGYAATVLGDGPTSYWRLGERPGAAVAVDQTNHHPGYYGGPPMGRLPHWVGTGGGDHDHAIDLDGLLSKPLGQFVHVPDNGHLAFAGRAPFSLEAWVRPRGFNGVTRRIVSKESATSGYLLGVQEDGLVFSRYGEAGWDTARTSVDATRWSHVVATYDGSALRVYVDGWLSAQSPSAVELPEARSDLSLGAKQSRWRYYAGGLDEVAIYPYALSDGQVLTHARVGGGAR